MDIIRNNNSMFTVRNAFRCIIGYQIRTPCVANPGHPRVRWALTDKQSDRTIAMVVGYKDDAIRIAVNILSRPPLNGLTEYDMANALEDYGYFHNIVEIDLNTALNRHIDMLEQLKKSFPKPVHITNYYIVDADDEKQALYFFVTATPDEDV